MLLHRFVKSKIYINRIIGVSQKYFRKPDELSAYHNLAKIGTSLWLRQDGKTNWIGISSGIFLVGAITNFIGKVTGHTKWTGISSAFFLSISIVILINEYAKSLQKEQNKNTDNTNNEDDQS